jgi:uncharacterized repeat protein (TIGR03803 family)
MTKTMTKQNAVLPLRQAMGFAIPRTNCLRTGLLGLAAAAALLSQTTPWTLTTLTGFASIGSDAGSHPYSSVTIGKDGVLYGTTPSTYEGEGGDGVVYALQPPASPGGSWTEHVLFTFEEFDPSLGTGPLGAVVIGAGGVLYGTTSAGGASGIGTVFSMTPPASPNDGWTEAVLYSFAGGGDGAYPETALVMDKGGVLYGTTTYGGTGPCYSYEQTPGCGVVFSLTPPKAPGGAWTEAVLHTFTGGADGAFPNGVTSNADGVLYGTTQADGIAACPNMGGCGTVFTLTPPASSGGSWIRDTIYRFTGSPNDGAKPQAAVVIAGGLLYGSTAQGGQAGFGTVFTLAPPTGPGSPWTESVLYDFVNPLVEGIDPRGITLARNGAIYGISQGGGSLRQGTVFSLTPPSAPGGSWTRNVLYTFTGGDDGSSPYGTLVIGSGGVLYGTTYEGGSTASGTVFELTP